jgi:hypothetical protein
MLDACIFAGAYKERQMKPSLQEKIDRYLALNASDLMAATGYGRRAIKRINPPLVCGKIRLSDFWRHHAKLGVQEKTVTTTAISLEPPSDLQSIMAMMRAPPPGASRACTVARRG